VHDAVAGGHDVELAWSYHRLRAEAVAMLDFAVEQPADRLQAGMRMSPDLHTRRATDVLRTVMIKEAPGADHADLPVWQGACHFGRLAQRDPASRKQQFLGSALTAPGTQILLWPRIKITHVPAGLRSTHRLVRLSAGYGTPRR
jgi:hypothetical protein